DLAIGLDEARSNDALLPDTALVDKFYAEAQKQQGERGATSSVIARRKPGTYNRRRRADRARHRDSRAPGVDAGRAPQRARTRTGSSLPALSSAAPPTARYSRCGWPAPSACIRTGRCPS